MVIYQRRETNPNKRIRGKNPVYVSSYKDLMEKLPNINLDSEVLCIDELPVIQEKYYVAGEDSLDRRYHPSNRYHKWAPIRMLDDFSRDENGRRVPFYRQRRESFRELNEIRKRRIAQGDYGLIYYAGLGWKPGGIDQVTRLLTVVKDFLGVESFLRSYHSADPVNKIRIRQEYSPKNARREGAKVYFSVPSVTTDEHYTMEKNALHNIAFLLDSYMIACMSRIKSTHNCGDKENSRQRFGGHGRPIMVEPLCEHDVAAFLQFLLQYQARFRAGESLDSVWDPVERIKTTIPMFLSPILLPTPGELHDFRVLYHNTVIRRPKRDKQRGGFLRNEDGGIVYDSWKPLWEEEIEPIMWTRISDLGKNAMFIRQHVVDLPFFEKK